MTNLTRLRLSTEDASVQMGSSEVVSPRTDGPLGMEEVSQAEFDAAKPLTQAEFNERCKDPRYQPNPLDPRPSAQFRREAEAGLMKGNMQRQAREQHAASTQSLAERVYELEGGRIPMALIEHVAKEGRFLNAEHQLEGYNAAKASGSANAMMAHEARIALGHVEDNS